MQTGRRAFLGTATTAGMLAFRSASLRAQSSDVAPPQGKASTPGPSLPPPIGGAERMQRIAKAQGLMRAAGLKAVLVEAGYISNGDDEALLMTSEGRAPLVLALAQAVEADLATRGAR